MYYNSSISPIYNSLHTQTYVSIKICIQLNILMPPNLPTTIQSIPAFLPWLPVPSHSNSISYPLPSTCLTVDPSTLAWRFQKGAPLWERTVHLGTEFMRTYSAFGLADCTETLFSGLLERNLLYIQEFSSGWHVNG